MLEAIRTAYRREMYVELRQLNRQIRRLEAAERHDGHERATLTKLVARRDALLGEINLHLAAELRRPGATEKFLARFLADVRVA
jgi:hypothetical protein